MNSKDEVRDFWSDAVCCKKLLLPSCDVAGFKAQAAGRFRLEPYILSFADF